jgi:hypothetical protein
MRNYKEVDADVSGANRVVTRSHPFVKGIATYTPAEYQAERSYHTGETTINGRVYPNGMVRSGLAHAMEARRAAVVRSADGQSNPA